MAEVITPESLGFIGGFGLHATPEPLYHHEEVVETKQEIKSDKPVDNPPEKKDDKHEKQRLADVLRADRESRSKSNKELQEAQSYKAKYTELETNYNKLKSAPSFEDDPVGYVKARKLPPQVQIALGEALLYDLAPEKAPAELRFKLYEAKTNRERENRELQIKEEQVKRDYEMANKQIESFANSLSDAAKSFESGSFPESEVWFTGSDDQLDHFAYSKSLLATANNMANMANKQGKTVDLSASNVAKTLELEIARRQAVRDKKRSSNRATTDTSTKQSTGETLGTKGLNTGAIDGPAKSEQERIQRAIAAAFGN